MHLTDDLRVLENAYPKGLKDSIVDLLDMILKYGLVFFPHNLSQLETQLLLKVGATFRYADRVSCPVASVHIGPSLELFHGNTI